MIRRPPISTLTDTLLPYTTLFRFKFRSMRPVDETESQTNWNVAADNRVGPVGKFLRRTSIDELPQLWNIFRGDMTVVGPRPERPHFVEQFSTQFRSEEHTSELKSLMRISYAVFCLTKQTSK